MASVIRSLFFAPANRPDLIAKMPRSQADISVVCLEDATPDAEKLTARAPAGEAFRKARASGWNGLVFVRVNHQDTEWFEGDLAAVKEYGFDGVVLPKVDGVHDLKRYMVIRDKLGLPSDFKVVLGIESGLGVIHIEDILSTPCGAVAVYFGGDDYASNVGMVRSESNFENQYPRSRVALHCRMHKLSVFDQAVGATHDEERFRRECKEARGFGFTGKICLSPRQVAFTHEEFRPSDAEIDWSRRVLETYAEAEARGIGTPTLDGVMVEGPALKRAEAILARAKELGL